MCLRYSACGPLMGILEGLLEFGEFISTILQECRTTTYAETTALEVHAAFPAEEDVTR